jgi:hypothetical protein
MIIQMKTVQGKKGETVCYSIPNFAYNEASSSLSWDTFRFYTPEGILDEGGYKYFEVEEDEVLVERDMSLNKALFVIAKSTGVEAIEIYEGTSANISMGLEGDIIITGYIPADTGVEIQVEYKEVTG